MAELCSAKVTVIDVVEDNARARASTKKGLRHDKFSSNHTGSCRWSNSHSESNHSSCDEDWLMLPKRISRLPDEGLIRDPQRNISLKPPITVSPVEGKCDDRGDAIVQMIQMLSLRAVTTIKKNSNPSSLQAHLEANASKNSTLPSAA